MADKIAIAFYDERGGQLTAAEFPADGRGRIAIPLNAMYLRAWDPEAA